MKFITFLGVFFISVSCLALDMYVKDGEIIYQSEKTNWQQEHWIKVSDPIEQEMVKNAKSYKVVNGNLEITNYTQEELDAIEKEKKDKEKAKKDKQDALKTKLGLTEEEWKLLRE